jgi:TPR repeat protein
MNWFKKSAEQGDIEAQFSVGCCYVTGDCVDKDEKEGFKWIKLAAKNGFKKAITYLALHSV